MTISPETEIKRLNAQIEALRMTVVFLISAMDGVGPGGNADYIVLQLLSQEKKARRENAETGFAIASIIAMIDDIREP